MAVPFRDYGKHSIRGACIRNLFLNYPHGKKMYDLPNHLIVVGAQKSGTTWIQHVLDSDSRVCASVDQELHFFDREGDVNFEEYCGLFKDRDTSSMTVDVTPNYMYSARTLRSLAILEGRYEFRPKIVVVLREPVERAFSSYQMYLNYGKASRSFEEHLKEGDQIYEKSLYGKFFQRWFEAGYGHRLNIIFFDDILRKPEQVMCRLSKIAGLNPSLDDRYVDTPVNKGGLDRVKFLQLLRRRVGSTLRGHGMHSTIHLLKTRSLVKWIERANKKKLSLDEASRNRAQKAFADDIDKLDLLLPELEIKKRWGYE